MKDYIIAKCKESKSGYYTTEKGFAKTFPQEYDEISSANYPEGFLFKQKLYHYINEDADLLLGVCPFCGKRCNFVNIYEGYHEYCSRDCINKSGVVSKRMKDTINKRTNEEKEAIKIKKQENYKNKTEKEKEEIKRKQEQTTLKKYGVKHAIQNKSVLKKRTETCLERYGETTPLKNTEIKEKIRKTNQERYGVVNVSQAEEIKQKREETFLKNYGVNNPAQSKKVQEKIKRTCMLKYGETSPLKNEEIKEKIRKTNQERYGVDNVSQAEEVKQKREETFLKNYGVSNSLRAKEVRDKIKETNQERYGGNSPVCSHEIKEKTKQTNLTKYGKEYYTQTEDFKSKTKKTSIKKYGVEHPSQSDEVKKRVVKTNQEKYGVNSFLETKTAKEANLKKVRKNTVEKHNFLLGYTENGQWICKCTNPNCDKCIEKTYITNANINKDRIIGGYETCTKLNPIGVLNSGREQELLLYIQDIYNGKIIENDRKLLNGKELDIYLPEKKLAFEFNGVYWHSDIYKEKDYHYNKSISCLNKGVQLIHIWEDDWLNKQDILKNLIRGKLGLHTNKLNARNCVVKEIDSKTAKEFCETYHIQGYTSSQVKLGLYKDNQLVMVCLFGPVRRISGAGKKDGEWELYRMCSPFDTHVRGGASKLLKHFARLYNPKSIVTFADLSVSNGDVYEKMGFKKEYVVPPTYYWAINGVRYPRYRFQKSNLVECVEYPELTEDEVMRNRGYVKCWDAGKIKYRIDFYI